MDVLIVDDHALIRDALNAVVAEAAPGARVAEADSCQAAREQLAANPALHLVIVDLALPDGSGLELLRDIRRTMAATGVVVLSANLDPGVMSASLDAGAAGFIPKSAPRAIMLNALRIVLAGGIYIPAEAWPPRVEPAPAPRPRQTPQDLGLTDRQVDVLGLMVEGMSNKAIARRLDISEVTVKHHVTAVMRALQVQNRTEAAIAASRLGWSLPSAG